MANFQFNSFYQERYENNTLVATSETKFWFQNIPAGWAEDKNDPLNDVCIDFIMDKHVSFNAKRKSVEGNIYTFNDESNTVFVKIAFDKIALQIERITIERIDLGVTLIFYKEKESPSATCVNMLSSITSPEEMRNIYPERLYSDSELEEKIELFEDRIDTAQDYLSDEDDPNTRYVLSRQLYGYRRTLAKLNEEKQRRLK